MTYTFDLFDTCISRHHAYPRDLFYDLGLDLAPSSLSHAETIAFARLFQKTRIRAEKKAYRSALRSEAVTIYDIYSHFVSCDPDLPKTEALIAAEIEAEARSIYAVPSMLDRLQQLRDSGDAIIFISDMYIPSALLIPIISRIGIFKSGDKLYVSCDVGLAKHNGQLFQHVLEKEGLCAASITHVGDNPRADVTMAQKQGMKAELFRLATLDHSEVILAGSRFPRSPTRSFTAGINRRMRLMLRNASIPLDQSLEVTIRNTVTPFLLAYVSWILRHAEKRGIRRLYFVARDGEILMHIARILISPACDIELRYLHGSRLAWLPGFNAPGCDISQRSLIAMGTACSRQEILAALGLEEDADEPLRQLLAYDKSAWRAKMDKSETEKFLTETMSHPIASRVLADSANKKSVPRLWTISARKVFSTKRHGHSSMQAGHLIAKPRCKQ